MNFEWIPHLDFKRWLGFFIAICIFSSTFSPVIAQVSEQAVANSLPADGGSSASPTTPAPIDLDLTSTIRGLTADHLTGAHPVDIEVGAVTRTVLPGTLLTPAERLAVYQVASTGQQSILLGEFGNAVGGSFNLGPRFSQYVSSLVIPSGVTAVRDFGTASALNLTGNLTNAGSFFAVSSNSAVTDAVISVANFSNQQGALLTSVLPIGFSGAGNAVNNLNLTINAINNIFNAGTISSAGNLTASAGGFIMNALSPSAPAPVMQAMGDVNLISANLVNSGVIASQNGNINVATRQLSDIWISNLS